MNVICESKTCTPSLLVVKENAPESNRQEFDTLEKINLDWKGISTIKGEQQFQYLSQQHQITFGGQDRNCEGFKGKTLQ